MLYSFSLQDPADNVSVKIENLSHHDYIYPIIHNHPSGSFWYHAHWKGSTWFQVKHLILCDMPVLIFLIIAILPNPQTCAFSGYLHILCKNTILKLINAI